MIDHQRLKEMEADFGADETALIVDAFLEEATAAMKRLRTGWHDDAVRLERLHFLKGCARTIGAMRLGDLCEAAESRPPAADGLRTLEREFDAVRAALRDEKLRQAG